MCDVAALDCQGRWTTLAQVPGEPPTASLEGRRIWDTPSDPRLFTYPLPFPLSIRLWYGPVLTLEGGPAQFQQWEKQECHRWGMYRPYGTVGISRPLPLPYEPEWPCAMIPHPGTLTSVKHISEIAVGVEEDVLPDLPPGVEDEDDPDEEEEEDEDEDPVEEFVPMDE